MTDDHNLYHLMLGLPNDVTAPDYYELLGLERFEDGEQEIRDAAIDANQKLLAWQNSKYHQECDQLMDEVVKARHVLLSPQMKSRHDRRLAERLGIEPPGQEPSQRESDELLGTALATPSLELERTSPLPPRVRRRRSPAASAKPKARRRSRSGGAFEPIKSFLQQVYWALPWGKLIFAAVAVAAIIFCVKYVRLPEMRTQKQYFRRTTSSWLYWVESGHGTHYYEDKHWYPLASFIGLDWAALPDLFEALTNERTETIAEAILNKHDDSRTIGKPYLEDLVAGLEHSDDRVRLWAIRFTPLLLVEEATSTVPKLEEIRDTGPESLALAATESLAKINAHMKVPSLYDDESDLTEAEKSLEEQLRRDSLPPSLR